MRCLPLVIPPLLCSFALCAQSQAAETYAGGPPVVATLGARTLHLDELDAAGGREIYEAANLLHEMRMRALVQWLTVEVLRREARARGITEEQLMKESGPTSPSPVTDAEIDAFLASQGGDPSPDAKRRRQAQLYLGVKRQADAKREYVARLFDKYQVRISLTAPGAPPAEEIRGAQTPLLGAPSAPVTIVVFSDYQCPYCRQLSHTLDTLLDRFDRSVRVIYRHYPLRENTERLAHAALCAADQQQFERYHESLFADDRTAPDPADLAEVLELDITAFVTCMDEQRHQSRIRADKEEGQRLGLQGTPTLFINGQRLRGAQTLDQLTQAVQQALTSGSTRTSKTASSQ
jgi:protein-disulfide isomerase